MKITPIEFVDQTPGTILQDFQAMIDLIGKEGLRVPGDRGLFPIDRLAELNARLAKPLKLALKRPQLRSYPNLTGLYMLLRSSGMGVIEGHGSTQRLVLDQTLLERWQQLSPADRYWNLLGVWWVLSRSTGISDRADAVFELSFTMRRIGNAKEGPVEFLASSASPLCLVDMFGVAEVDLHHRPGDYFGRASVRRTPVGTQLWNLYEQLMGETLALARLNDDIKTEPSVRMKTFQRWIRPVASQWRELLLPLTPRAVFGGTLRIKVSLHEVWRRFDVPSTATLGGLAGKILSAYRFDNDHLFEFRVPSPAGGMIEYGASDEGLPAYKTTLGEVPLRARQKIVFHYDFGDSWRFDVLIEAMEPRISKAIKLIGKEGKAPEQYYRS